MMKNLKPTQQRQAGLSLVEIMIGLVLGLVVISAVFNTYLGTSRSSRFSEGLQVMQENGRYGITTLQRGIRLAGYNPEGDLDPFDIANSNASTIVVRQTDLYDCNGQSTATVGGVAVNSYSHDQATETITCTGNVNPTAMPVVEGVERMRILWGIDANNDDVPEQYIPYDAGIDAGQVVAMRVAILVNSGDDIRTRAGEETHVLLDEEYPTNDKIARHVFSSTVLLRNRR